MQSPESPTELGKIIAIEGSVIDVRFPGAAPSINTMLRIGEQEDIIAEVASLTGANTARALIFTPSSRLALGAPVIDTKHPICAPVGEAVLGRVLNVFGEPIDLGDRKSVV